jgi:hypothetical protein
VKKPNVEDWSDISKAARGSDDHPNKPKPGLPGIPTDAAKLPQAEILDFAQDFACGFPLGQTPRSHPQNGSTLQKTGLDP